MAGFLDDVGTYLAANGVGNVTGGSVNIFVGMVPPDPANLVAILGLTGYNIPDMYIKEFIYPRFQIFVRNTDFDTGEAKLKAIRDLLHVQIDLDLTNHKVLRCHADQEGGPLGEDPETGRFEWSINFSAQARYVA